jgi:GMP reductase
MKINDKQIGYQNIFLKPQMCMVESRDECNTGVVFGDRGFAMPIYPANMKSVVNIDTCKFLASWGYFYTMHRFEIDVLEFIREMDRACLFTSISVGINEDSYEILEKIYQEPLTVNYITIDVANAWSQKCYEMIMFIKDKFPETFLIVGNVATADAVDSIEGYGADAIKVGIAGGSVCITKNKTGIHRPMVSTILDCVSARKKVPIIADGGIVEHGDIAKALACGASMVMAGSLFAGYDQSAGSLIEINDTEYKEYYGSASKHNKNEIKNIEGKKTLIKYRGDMTRLLTELKEDLQSSISYLGGRSLGIFKTVDYYEV